MCGVKDNDSARDGGGIGPIACQVGRKPQHQAQRIHIGFRKGGYFAAETREDLAQDLEAEGRGHATALINAGRETQLLEEKFTLQINSLRDEMKSLQANGSMMRVSNQVWGGTGGHGGARGGKH